MIQSATTENPQTDPTANSLDISSIAAGVLGGVLFFIILGIVLFIIWRIRRYRQKKLAAQSTSLSSRRHTITPALYNIAISRENSIPLSDRPGTDHIYEDLP